MNQAFKFLKQVKLYASYMCSKSKPNLSISIKLNKSVMPIYGVSNEKKKVQTSEVIAFCASMLLFIV